MYDITGSCNCSREWQGTRPIAGWSCVKFDVTKYTIASELWRQPPSFCILLTHACLLVCHIYLLFHSVLLIFTPSADVVFSQHTCLMQRNGFGGHLLLKQVTSVRKGSSWCNQIKKSRWNFLLLKLRMKDKNFLDTADLSQFLQCETESILIQIQTWVKIKCCCSGTLSIGAGVAAVVFLKKCTQQSKRFGRKAAKSERKLNSDLR